MQEGEQADLDQEGEKENRQDVVLDLEDDFHGRLAEDAFLEHGRELVQGLDPPGEAVQVESCQDDDVDSVDGVGDVVEENGQRFGLGQVEKVDGVSDLEREQRYHHQGDAYPRGGPPEGAFPVLVVPGEGHEPHHPAQVQNRREHLANADGILLDLEDRTGDVLGARIHY
jgi:hypothetical protein